MSLDPRWIPPDPVSKQYDVNADHQRRLAVMERRQVPMWEPTRLIGDAGEPGFGAQWKHGDDIVPGEGHLGFYKDAYGRVQVVGRAGRTAYGSNEVFTLPDGYRPGQTSWWPAVFLTTTGVEFYPIQVTTAGVVSHPSTASYQDTGFLSLDVVSFRVVTQP